MLSRIERAWRAFVRALRTPVFWWLLLACVVLAAALALLTVYAVARHDSFLRITPLICGPGAPDRKLFLVAVAAPPWLVFVLTTVGEVWLQLERRRAGHAARWFHFWLFFALASVLGGLVLFGLAC